MTQVFVLNFKNGPGIFSARLAKKREVFKGNEIHTKKVGKKKIDLQFCL